MTVPGLVCALSCWGALRAVSGVIFPSLQQQAGACARVSGVQTREFSGSKVFTAHLTSVCHTIEPSAVHTSKVSLS